MKDDIKVKKINLIQVTYKKSGLGLGDTILIRSLGSKRKYVGTSSLYMDDTTGRKLIDFLKKCIKGKGQDLISKEKKSE